MLTPHSGRSWTASCRAASARSSCSNSTWPCSTARVSLGTRLPSASWSRSSRCGRPACSPLLKLAQHAMINSWREKARKRHSTQARGRTLFKAAAARSKAHRRPAGTIPRTLLNRSLRLFLRENGLRHAANLPKRKSVRAAVEGALVGLRKRRAASRLFPPPQCRRSGATAKGGYNNGPGHTP